MRRRRFVNKISKKKIIPTNQPNIQEQMTENVSTESVDDSNIDDMNTAPLLVQLDIVSKQKEAYSELCQELREDKKKYLYSI